MQDKINVSVNVFLSPVLVVCYFQLKLSSNLLVSLNGHFFSKLLLYIQQPM